MGILVFLALLQTFSAQAASSDSYYGRDFATKYSNGSLRGDALRDTLNTILKSAHSPGPDGFDVIGNNCSSSDCYRHTEVGYGEARKIIFGDLYLVKQDNGWAVPDLYCDRLMDADDLGGMQPGPGKLPNHKYVNVEHTWPQSQFTRKYQNEMQKSDLHHLFPTDSEMNSRRSSYGFGEVAQPQRALKCSESSLGQSRGGETVFQPPENHRGNVARALFYFAVRYEMNIDKEEEDTLRKWDREDPIDSDEKARNEKIFGFQKDRNPFVDFPGLADRIENF